MSERQPIYRSTADERAFEASYLHLEEAHARATKAISENEITPDLFVGLYDEKILAKDAATVQRLENAFETSSSKAFADILEAVVLEHGELSDWFGPESTVIKSSRFDDYVNKIDMVIEMRDEEHRFSHLALGVDVTFGSRDLSKKFADIKAKIDAETLAEIKYFHSDRQHVTGRLRQIPQVVAGAEIERVKELGLLWMNRRNKELAEHSMQVLLLEEAILQLETFAAYAERTGKQTILPIFEREAEKMRSLLEEKRQAGIPSIKNDAVFAEIKRNLSIFSDPV